MISIVTNCKCYQNGFVNQLFPRITRSYNALATNRGTPGESEKMFRPSIILAFEMAIFFHSVSSFPITG